MSYSGILQKVWVGEVVLGDSIEQGRGSRHFLADWKEFCVAGADLDS